MEENKQPEESTVQPTTSAVGTVAGVIKALILLAIIAILIWYFFFRAVYPKTLTEEMVTSDALINAVEDQIVLDLNASGINDVLWNAEGCYITYVDLSVSGQATVLPENYMVGERIKLDSKDASHLLMEASGLVDKNDTVYQYNFSLPMLMEPVFTDDVSEFKGDTSHTIQADGYVLCGTKGFRVVVTEITYPEEFQEALDLAENFGWLAELG